MPYAYGATIQHEFDGAKLNIWLTFRHPMDQNVEPALNLWTLTVDTIDKAISDSDWVDEYTLWLESVAVVVYPDRVLLAYDGPSGNLQTTWGKDWEPWGDSLSTDIGKGKSFIDRGDPAIGDFTWANQDFFPIFTFDLDLSGIVPAGATAVLLRVEATNAAIPNFLRFRTKGNVNWANKGMTRIQIANVTYVSDIIVALGTNRIVEMSVTAGVWAAITITVGAWWL